MNITKPFSRFAPETYDAVWSIALALKGAEDLWRNEDPTANETATTKTSSTVAKKLKKLKLFDYTRKDLAQDFLEQFGRLKFQGISVMLFCAHRGRSQSKLFFLFFLYITGKCFIPGSRPCGNHGVPSNSICPHATCCSLLPRD